jgi:Ca2+-transporting ATPase
LIAWQGALLAAVTLTAFAIGLRWYGTESAGLHTAVTMAFMTLALAQVCHVFNARSQRRSLREGLFTNCWLWAAVVITIVLQLVAVYVPLLQRPLHTVALNSTQWGVTLICAVLPMVVVEGVKLGQRRANRAKRD